MHNVHQGRGDDINVTIEVKISKKADLNVDKRLTSDGQCNEI